MFGISAGREQNMLGKEQKSTIKGCQPIIFLFFIRWCHRPIIKKISHRTGARRQSEWMGNNTKGKWQLELGRHPYSGKVEGQKGVCEKIGE